MWICQLCVAYVLHVIRIQTLGLHTLMIETLSVRPPLIRFFCNYVALRGEMGAFNHLSYQLCAKQQPH